MAAIHDISTSLSRRGCLHFASPCTTSSTIHAVSFKPCLSQDKYELFRFLNTQLNLPTRPFLYVHGTRKASFVTDFCFRLHLTETLLGGWVSTPCTGFSMELLVAKDEDGISTFPGGHRRTCTYTATKTRLSASTMDTDTLDLEAGFSEDGCDFFFQRQRE